VHACGTSVMVGAAVMAKTWGGQGSTLTLGCKLCVLATLLRKAKH